MRKSFWIYFPLFLMLFSSVRPAISSINEFKEEKINIIGKEYLRNLPSSDYIVGPGDNLLIRVSREIPGLTAIANVDGEGTIYLPRLNRIYVSGLSINEMNKVLNDAYKEFVKLPEVEVTVTQYRPIRVFVKGEVESPGLQVLRGSFQLKNNINLEIENERSQGMGNNNIENSNKFYFPTVFDAIREAGGLTKFSDISKIKLLRKNQLSEGGGEKYTVLNFQDTLFAGDNSQNIRIYDSDVIEISKSNVANQKILFQSIISNLNKKFINVFVTGRVNDPGLVKISRASVLTDAIEIAGGANVIRGPATFIRFNNDGSIDKRKFRYRKNAGRGKYRNPNLREGDLIIIGESALSNATEYVNEITKPFTGIFSTYGLFKVITE